MGLFKEVLKKHRKNIAFYLILGVVLAFLSVYSVNYFQVVLDSFGSGTLTLPMVIFYGIILILTAVLSYVDTYPEQKLKNGLYLDFKLQALKKMKTIDYLHYQKLGTGAISQRVEDGADCSKSVYMDFWFKLIRNLIPSALLSLIFIGSINLTILLFVLIGYVVVVIVTTLLIKKLYNVKEKILVNKELLNKHLIRGFMELVVFRTNKKYNSEIKITQDGIKNIVDGKTKIRMIHELFFAIFELLINFIKIGVIVYAVITKNLSVGGLVAIITLLSKAYEPVAIFNVEYIDYKLNKVGVNRFIELLSLPDSKNLNSGFELKNVEGEVELNKVNFSYDNKKVLNNISLKILKGQKVAFVGETGSGKSTIIKLITGLISTNDGKVLIDGKNLLEINLNSYYNYLSYLSQESPIFDGTLKENLIFDKKVSDSEIEKVLSLVCLDEFYKKLPNGLNTQMGEKGVLVSGGERQRIALARLFFDNSKIIILDEATSAMDNITEKKVMKNIYSNLKGKTIIIIAHRLATIKNVDNIFVLQNGEILSNGNYAKLLESCEYFKILTEKENLK